jgi:hypothetical protein
MSTATAEYALIKPQVGDDVRPDEDISTLADQVEETLLTCYGVVARGRRETSATTAGAVERGVLRLDGVDLKGGIFYTVELNTVEVAVTSGETAIMHARLSTSGAATLASASIGYAQSNANAAFVPRQGPTLVAEYAPSSDVTVSVLLTLGKSGGVNNAVMAGSSAQPICLYVKAWGVDPGDSGVDVAP